jgi:hypothetical protein
MGKLEEGIGGIKRTWHIPQLDLFPVLRDEAPAESDSMGLEETGHSDMERLRGSG